MKNSPQDLSYTAFPVRGGPFNGQLLAVQDGDKTLEVRVGTLRIHHQLCRIDLTAELYLAFTGAEVVALSGLNVVRRRATPEEAMWAGVPRGN